MPFLDLLPSHPASPRLQIVAPPLGTLSLGVHKLTKSNPIQEQCQQAGKQTMNNDKPHYIMRFALRDADFQDIPADNVISVHFTPEGGMSGLYNSISAEGCDAVTLLQHIDFENPLTTNAKPGAIITGTLTVTYSGAGNKQEARTFRLLGASLLQDVIYPSTYYHASDVLQRCLEKQ